ncbi:hypothetical protein GCM10009539_41980 [Cryptosporangium japonicum]|uniref:Integral membrane protein n=1 Tax=Cryptosporangium japonicum TaxID=80872 RepID=A0ABN0UJV0_9ACTN
MGRPGPATAIGAAETVSSATDVSPGRALTVQAGLALAVAVGGRLVLSRTGTAWIAVAALAGLVPPAFTGHAAGAGNHAVAVVGAALWTGGLVALLLIRRTDVLADAARACSRIALWCFVAVGLSGVLNAGARRGSPDALLHSRYGLLVVGAVHRARTLPRLPGGAFRCRSRSCSAHRRRSRCVRCARAAAPGSGGWRCCARGRCGCSVIPSSRPGGSSAASTVCLSPTCSRRPCAPTRDTW